MNAHRSASMIVWFAFALAAHSAGAAPVPELAGKRIETYAAGAALLDAGENEQAARFYEKALTEGGGFVELAEGLIEARSRLCAPNAAIAFRGKSIQAAQGARREDLSSDISTGERSRLRRDFGAATGRFSERVLVRREGRGYALGRLLRKGSRAVPHSRSGRPGCPRSGKGARRPRRRASPEGEGSPAAGIRSPSIAECLNAGRRRCGRRAFSVKPSRSRKRENSDRSRALVSRASGGSMTSVRETGRRYRSTGRLSLSNGPWGTGRRRRRFSIIWDRSM